MNYEYNVKLFNTVQQNCIDKAIAIADEKYKEVLDIMTSVNSIGKPIFNDRQLDQILKGILQGASVSNIKFYTKLNTNMEPIYNATQMNEIRIGFYSKMTLEDILLFARLNKNNQPVFSYSVIYLHRSLSEQHDRLRFFVRSNTGCKGKFYLCFR